MDRDEAVSTLNQLADYTRALCKAQGIDYEQKGKNHHGPFESGRPFGAINHYTASPASVTKERPLGRIPVLLNRFARGSTQRVGVQFVAWDCLVPDFDRLRAKYPLLKDMAAEVLYFGDDLSFWHAGWVNRMCYGIEIRNVGQLVKRHGIYYWSHGQNRYHGREPIKIGNSWWEPYTREQMTAALWVHRLMAAVHDIDPVWFLSHTHVTNTRIDAGKHFPIHEMRAATLLEDAQTPLNEVKFLKEFKRVGYTQLEEDPLVSEDSLHRGMYRDDWDGTPSADDIRHGISFDASDGLRDEFTQLGYYYKDDPEPGTNGSKSLADLISIFQTRWKVRDNRGRWIQEIPITGQMNDVTMKKLQQMVRWWGNL